jgi:hypothetical protein
MMTRFCLLAMAAAGLVVAASTNGNPVTFNKDVLPIMQKNCQGCHRPGEVGPMSFMSYESTRPWAKAIKAAVVAKKMPPWFADPQYGHFANERKLTEEETHTLIAWVDAGAPEGLAKDKPASVNFPEGWTYQPDVVISMLHPYHVPAKGIVEYTYFAVPSGFTKDTWVTSAEVRPMDRSVVHHVIVFVRPPNSSYMQQAKYGEGFVPVTHTRDENGASIPGTEKRVQGNDRTEEGAGTENLCQYVPGTQAQVFTVGDSAKLIPAGADIIFQVHFTPNGQNEVDDTIKLGLTLAKEPPKHRYLTLAAGANTKAFEIPAKDGNYESHSEVVFNQDAQLVWFSPHMHLRGKDMNYRLVYPTGESEVVLSVPHYSFAWQLGYVEEKPVVLPKGTHMLVTAHHDNSANNPFNPNPNVTVRWGDQSWEEMMFGHYAVIVDRDADPKKVATTLSRSKPAAD